LGKYITMYNNAVKILGTDNPEVLKNFFASQQYGQNNTQVQQNNNINKALWKKNIINQDDPPSYIKQYRDAADKFVKRNKAYEPLLNYIKKNNYKVDLEINRNNPKDVKISNKEVLKTRMPIWKSYDEEFKKYKQYDDSVINNFQKNYEKNIGNNIVTKDRYWKKISNQYGDPNVGGRLDILYNNPAIIRTALRYSKNTSPSMVMSNMINEGLTNVPYENDVLKYGRIFPNNKLPNINIDRDMLMAKSGVSDLGDYVIHGYNKLGLDDFGSNIDKIKKYLPVKFTTGNVYTTDNYDFVNGYINPTQNENKRLVNSFNPSDLVQAVIATDADLAYRRDNLAKDKSNFGIFQAYNPGASKKVITRKTALQNAIIDLIHK
jgi:hypothetical protein